MIEVSDDRFEELVEAGLDRIPPQLLRRMDNVAIIISDRHPDSPHILGLYEGVGLTERAANHAGFLPDVISIFRESLFDYCSSEEELVEQVAVTVIHEIGHHFGLDDDELHRLGWA
ncbi:metallopeptidase family protein [Corynebacterium ulceribovis]|uniref:metallopeptidase family protein n=1 Tax=Corynebacterium ulceribovis TaxID=487732 RepID=UPI00036E8220|nr:metallopeptidase family protein [Corynebacterium ulceribovis]